MGPLCVGTACTGHTLRCPRQKRTMIYDCCLLDGSERIRTRGILVDSASKEVMMASQCHPDAIRDRESGDGRTHEITFSLSTSTVQAAIARIIVTWVD